MKRKPFSDLSLSELIELFVQISVAQHRALVNFETRKYNRLFAQRLDLERELKSRPGDQRGALLPLLDYEDIQIRLNAAYAVRPIALAEARYAFERIAAENYYPQTANALFALDAIDKGTWISTPGLE